MVTYDAKIFEAAIAKAQSEGWAEWVRTANDRLAICRGYYFDLVAAEKRRTFCRKFLRHCKGREWSGQPFELLDWQWKDVIGPLYGWMRPDGRRRFTRAFITMAKKNGKSGLCSAVSVMQLVADREPGPRVYCAANDKKQAGIVYDDAAAMVKASPILRRKLSVLPSTKRIVYGDRNGFLAALSADVETAEGIDASCVVYDELHMAKSSKMHDVLRYAGDAREQPLFLMITTAGVDTQSVCFQEYKHAKDTLEGRVEELELLPAIYEAGADDPIDDPATWRKANPSLGVTIKLEKFQRDLEEAKTSPRKMTNFRRRKLNQWVSSAEVWIPQEKWAACKGAFPSNIDTLPLYMGLDLADSDDIAALIRIWRDGKRFYVKPLLWCPEDKIQERLIEGRVPYHEWAKAGHLLSIPGATIDQNVIGAKVREIALASAFRELGYDPWQASKLVGELAEEGIECVKVPQVMSHLSEPAKLLERIVLSGELIHDGNPVMEWMIGNVRLKEDSSGNIRPDKGRSADKIDGPAGLVTGLNRAMHSKPERGSVYATRGIRVL